MESCKELAHQPNVASQCNFASIFFREMLPFTIGQILFSFFGLFFELNRAFGLWERFKAWRERRVATTVLEAQPQTSDASSVVVSDPHPATIAPAAPAAPAAAFPVVETTLGGMMRDLFGAGAVQNQEAVLCAAFYAIDIVLRITYTATATEARTIFVMEFFYSFAMSLVAVSLLFLHNEIKYNLPLTTYIFLNALRVLSSSNGKTYLTMQKL